MYHWLAEDLQQEWSVETIVSSLYISFKLVFVLSTEPFQLFVIAKCWLKLVTHVQHQYCIYWHWSVTFTMYYHHWCVFSLLHSISERRREVKQISIELYWLPLDKLFIFFLHCFIFTKTPKLGNYGSFWSVYNGVRALQ